MLKGYGTSKSIYINDTQLDSEVRIPLTEYSADNLVMKCDA